MSLGARHPPTFNDYIARLVELEESAKAGKAGAWATSQPELRHADVDEINESWEMPRSLDPVSFGAGAALVGAAWLLAGAVRRRRGAVVR